MLKKLISVILATAMGITIFPLTVFAGGESYRSVLIRYQLVEFMATNSTTYKAETFSAEEGFKDSILYGVGGATGESALSEAGMPPLVSADGFILQAPDGSIISLKLYGSYNGAYGVVTDKLEQRGEYKLLSYPIPKGFELAYLKTETIEVDSGSSITFSIETTVNVTDETIHYISIPLKKIGSDDPLDLYKKYIKWKNGEVVSMPDPTPSQPVPPQPLSVVLTATPTASTVLVNGKNVAFDAYNINGNNYFKLRDLAYALNGSAKQFDVGWDGANNAISLISGKPYTVAGGEMTSKSTGDKTPAATTSKIYLDEKEVSFTAYNIEGNNYFKLRDIGEAFSFGVDWDGTNNTIVIDTSKGYTPN